MLLSFQAAFCFLNCQWEALDAHDILFFSNIGIARLQIFFLCRYTNNLLGSNMITTKEGVDSTQLTEFLALFSYKSQIFTQRFVRKKEPDIHIYIYTHNIHK